ncbi:MAG: sigma-70 family RNA polymerase sigma factor [Ruminococcus sp.]|nr:sigma-70 family RNA polymerase sigma factor [Ruminococcus sp.]
MTGTEYSALYVRSPEQAYQKLFDTYCNYVYAIVYNKIGRIASAEDIEECVSDIFADIFFKYDTGSGYEGEMQGYVNTVAKRKAITTYHRIYARTSHYTEHDDETMGRLRSDTDIEKDSDKSELQRIIIDMINQLGEPDSTIVIQKYYYDKKSGDIAKLLNMTAPAVRMRCKRAMSRLKDMLTQVGITL